MTDYTDAELSLMHLDGIACPDDPHARELCAALDEVDHLLRTLDDTPTGQSRPRARRATPSARGRPRAIREWALTNGYEISARGRIPTDIEHAYHDAP